MLKSSAPVRVFFEHTEVYISRSADGVLYIQIDTPAYADRNDNGTPRARVWLGESLIHDANGLTLVTDEHEGDDT